MRSIWMHPWDLVEADPSVLAAELRALGLDTCALALAYHGGRVLLPRSHGVRVRELDPGGVYFRPTPERYDSGLRPRAASEAALVPAFVEACGREGLALNGWLVVCHNDRLGYSEPDCCIRNVFGDRYPYALCPSNARVRRYAVALCADAAAIPGIARLELEALSFLGYDHGSLHDKTGIPLNTVARWLLSLCACEACRGGLGRVVDRAAELARDWLERYFDEAPGREHDADLRGELEAILGQDVLPELLHGRSGVITSLLEEVREATGAMHLNLRLSPDPLFVGGKSALPWPELAGRVDSATVTFFGASRDGMEAGLKLVPPPGDRRVPVFGGFVFHAPDCVSEADVHARFSLLHEARLDGFSFYCLGLAAPAQLQWLASALGAGKRPVTPNLQL